MSVRVVLYFHEMEGGQYFKTRTEAQKSVDWYRGYDPEWAGDLKVEKIVYKAQTVEDLLLDIFNHKY